MNVMPEPDKNQQTLKKASSDPDVAKVYANGFTLGLSNADVCVIFQQRGEPVALVDLSYTLAKTLVQRLGVLVNNFELTTGQSLLTTDEIDAKMQPKSGESLKPH